VSLSKDSQMMSFKSEIASSENKRAKASNSKIMEIRSLDSVGIKVIRMNSSSSQNKDTSNHILRRPSKSVSNQIRL
jgi:hypothetical protein